MKVKMTDRDAMRVAVAGALATALLAGGCAAPGPGDSKGAGGDTATVASDVSMASLRRTGFLSDYDRLKPVAGGTGMLCWRSDDVDWKQFDKVMFERIQVYFKGGTDKSVDPTDLKLLIDYFHDALVTAMKPVAQVVNATGPGTLQVRIALTDLVPTNTAASLVGTAIPFGYVAEVGAGAAQGLPAGSTAYLGQTGLAAQFRDGATGKVVAECADHQIGLKYAANMNAGVGGAASTWMSGYMGSFSQWTYAKAAFDKWSADFAQRFAALKKG